MEGVSGFRIRAAFEEGIEATSLYTDCFPYI